MWLKAFCDTACVVFHFVWPLIGSLEPCDGAHGSRHSVVVHVCAIYTVWHVMCHCSLFEIVSTNQSLISCGQLLSAVMVRVGMTTGSDMRLTIEEGRLKEGADAVLLPCTACVNSSVVLSRVLGRMAQGTLW